MSAHNASVFRGNNSVGVPVVVPLCIFLQPVQQVCACLLL